MFRPITIIVLTGGDDGGKDMLVQLSEDRRMRVVSQSNQVDRVYSEVVRRRPTAVVVSLDSDPETALTLCRQISRVSPETVIICASKSNSPDMIIESVRSGSREFLRLPIDQNELKRVIDRIIELTAGLKPSARKAGKIITVFSNKGGCGTSFIAANLAVGIGSPTALIDLNLQSGSQDILFGCKPKFSIVDLVRNRERLDDRLLSGFLVQYSETLSLLPAPYDPEAAEEISPENVVEILDFLRSRFDYLVLDLPHLFDAVTIAAMDQTDEFLLASTLDILSARATQKALVIMRRLGYPREKVKIIVNRYNKQSELEIEHLERYLQEKVLQTISDDHRNVLHSVNRGIPLISSTVNSPVIGDLKRLVEVCGAAPPQVDSGTRRNLLSSLFSRRNGSATSQLEKTAEEYPKIAAKKD